MSTGAKPQGRDAGANGPEQGELDPAADLMQAPQNYRGLDSGLAKSVPETDDLNQKNTIGAFEEG